MAAVNGSNPDLLARYYNVVFDELSDALGKEMDNVVTSSGISLDVHIDNEKQKGYIHILDESRAVANRKRSTSKGNLGFTNYLSECRSSGHR